MRGSVCKTSRKRAAARAGLQVRRDNSGGLSTRMSAPKGSSLWALCCWDKKLMINIELVQARCFGGWYKWGFGELSECFISTLST